MDKIIEILSGLKSGVDFSTAENIATGKILDSIDIASLITALEDEFDIEISMEYMDNKNFDSAKAIWEMIKELSEE
ncbi:MAG: acyl carrier protein [Clostridia bacterium]|nr:acyl carrier protein [Clostridia bacterium]